MTGFDMMLGPILKSLGIKPEDIGALANGMQETLGKASTMLPAILNNQRAIMKALNIEADYDDANGSGNGDGRDPRSDGRNLAIGNDGGGDSPG